MSYPTIYLYLYAQIRRDVGGIKVVRTNDIVNRIRRLKLPNHIRIKIIKDMENYDLIRKVNRDNYLLMDVDAVSPRDCYNNKFW